MIYYHRLVSWLSFILICFFPAYACDGRFTGGGYFSDETGCELANNFGKTYQGAVGSLEELALFASHTGKCWIAKKNELRRSLH